MYYEHVAYDMHPVPDVVQAVEAEKLTHPVCVVKLVVASEHD